MNWRTSSAVSIVTVPPRCNRFGSLPSLIAFRQSVEAAIPAEALKSSISLKRVCAAFIAAHTNGLLPISQWAIAFVRVLTSMGIIPSIMKTTWRDRLRTLIEGPPELDMKEISLKAGMGATFVRDIVYRGRTPSVEKFVAVCDALGVSAMSLIYGDDAPHVSIPIVGIVADGEAWAQTDASRADSIEFSVDGEDLIGIEVRGNSMSPVYRDGDYLVCRRRSGRHVDNLIGLDCAILTTDGKGFLKILKRGSRPGRYNLKSYDPHAEDITDVQVEWAAPVRWIRRRD